MQRGTGPPVIPQGIQPRDIAEIYFRLLRSVENNPKTACLGRKMIIRARGVARDYFEPR
jgi:hypothetical protein